MGCGGWFVAPRNRNNFSTPLTNRIGRELLGTLGVHQTKTGHWVDCTWSWVQEDTTLLAAHLGILGPVTGVSFCMPMRP